MRSSTIALSTADGNMPVYVSAADHDKGAVIVVHEAFGLTPHIEHVCKRLNEAGYTAVAPAFFHREGSPVFPYDQLETARRMVARLNEQTIHGDLSVCIEHLNSMGFEPHRIGLIGFCMGGAITFYAAAELEVGAAITYYGGDIGQGRFGMPSFYELVAHLRTPWLGLYGSDDELIPAEEVGQLDVIAREGRTETSVVLYNNAGHAFNNDSRPEVYVPAAASDAWRRTIGWLNDHLGSE